MRQLVERYQLSVYSFVLRILGHQHDAEDVCQDVFLRVFRSLHRWDPSRPFKPWLMKIAVNAARTRLRKNACRPVCPDGLEDLAIVASLDDTAEIYQEISKAVSLLRIEYRIVFALFHDEGLPYDEIARIVKRPVGTVKTWLHRARWELYRQMVARGMLGQFHVEPVDHET